MKIETLKNVLYVTVSVFYVIQKENAYYAKTLKPNHLNVNLTISEIKMASFSRPLLIFVILIAKLALKIKINA